MDFFAVACDNFGLINNTVTTVVMHQPPPNVAHSTSQISVNAPQLHAVDTTYLGSTIIDDEVGHRISKASQAFGGPQNTAWNRRGLHLITKLKITKQPSTDAAVWNGDLDSVQEAGAETQALPPQLSSTDNKAEVAGLGSRTRTYETIILSIYAMLRQLQVRWNGYLVGMNDGWLPKRLFYEDVSTGSRRKEAKSGATRTL
nr:unnamed protein product [Spirometra erinaceieuropaei]